MKSLSILLILYCSLCTFQCNYLKNVLFTTDNQTSNIADYSKYTVNDFLSQLLNETYDNNKQPSILSLDIYNISSKNVNDYLFSYEYSSLIFILSLFYIIIWILFIFSFCCHCCLFNQKVRYGLCGVLSFWFTYLPSMSILCFAFILYKKSNLFDKELNNISTSFHNFKSNSQYGYRNGSKAFIGFANMKEYMNEVITSIELITSKADSVFIEGSNEEIEENINLYDNYINELSQKGDMTLSNPSSPTKEGVTPIYVKELSLSNKNSMLNKIKNEYSSTIKKAYAIINDINKESRILTTNQKGKSQSSINQINQKIKDLNTVFNNKTSFLSENFITFYKTSFSLSMFYYKLIFISFMLLILLILFLLFIYFYVKNECVKIILHLLWNITLFLLICSLVASSSLMLISHYSKKSVPIINGMISSSKRSSIYDSSMNVCFNKNGDLYSHFQMVESGIDKINKAINQLSNEINSISYIEKSKSLPQLKSFLEKYYDDYSSSTTDVDINGLLSEISSKTNNVNDDIELCMTKDIWVTNKKKCNDEYIYMPKSEIGNRDSNSKNCFIIQDQYDDSDLFLLYGSSCNSEDASYIRQTILSITQFYLDNSNLLQDISLLIDTITDKYNSLMDDINKQSQFIEDTFKESINSHKQSYQSEELPSLFNCHLIKNDLMLFYNTTYAHFSSICFELSLLLLLISLLGIIAVISLISAIYHNSEKATQRYYDLIEKSSEYGDIELREK